MEPGGQLACSTKMQEPAAVGMQQAPRGPGQGLGLQLPPEVKTPPWDAHSGLVMMAQMRIAAVGGRKQQEPLGWQGEAAQGTPGVNWATVGQLAAVVFKHEPVAGLQQAPEGLQLAAAQVVLANQVPLHAEAVVCEQGKGAAWAQQAPVGTQGLGWQLAGLAYQVRGAAHWVCTVMAQEPVVGSQQEPVVVVEGQGFGEQVPPLKVPTQLPGAVTEHPLVAEQHAPL